MANLAAVPFGWERTAMAVENVRERLVRASTVLAQAKVAYAVVGGNAVAEWVGRVDQAAVRFTQDVDILIDRGDLEAAKRALTAVGFVHTQAVDMDIFLDGPAGRVKDAIHILYAGEKVLPDHVAAAPAVGESEPAEKFQVVALAALVRMKLTAFRLKDRVHLLDLIGVGLVDQTWTERLPPELASRLQQLLDNPDG